MALAEQRFVADVSKYVSDPDPKAVMGIAKHLGIALRRADARYVACSDKNERIAVRDRFLKRKLALKLGDEELDQAVLEICARMKATRRKPRVTFYYLLAERFSKVSMFT